MRHESAKISSYTAPPSPASDLLTLLPVGDRRSELRIRSFVDCSWWRETAAIEMHVFSSSVTGNSVTMWNCHVSRSVTELGQASVLLGDASKQRLSLTARATYHHPSEVSIVWRYINSIIIIIIITTLGFFSAGPRLLSRHQLTPRRSVVNETSEKYRRYRTDNR